MTEIQEGQVFGAGEAPAVASSDPANLAGPGVTQNPPDAAAVYDVGSLAAENARLRAELIAENERLRAAVDEARAFGVSAQGLSDEDVRRFEHPDEFADEYAALGEHQALVQQHQALSDRVAAAERLVADARSQRAGFAQPTAPADPSQGGVGVTADTVADPSQVSAPVGTDVSDSSVTHTGVPSVVGDARQSRDLSALTDDQLRAELDRRQGFSDGSDAPTTGTA